MNMTLFGNENYAYVNKSSRGHTGLGWPNPMTVVLVRRRKFGHRDQTQGEDHETTEAETRVMCLQAKDGWQPPERSPHRAFRESMASPTS